MGNFAVVSLVRHRWAEGRCVVVSAVKVLSVIFIGIVGLNAAVAMEGASEMNSLPSVVEELRPGLCISNYPQEKIYLSSTEKWFREEWTYQCQYYCMNAASEIDKVAAIHKDAVWFGQEDGAEYLCLGVRLKWVDTAALPTNRWGYYTVIGVRPFSPLQTESPELLYWYKQAGPF